MEAARPTYGVGVCAAGGCDEAFRVPACRTPLPDLVRRQPERVVGDGGVLCSAGVARLRPRGPHVHGAQAAAVLRPAAVHPARTAHHQGRAGRLALRERRLRVPRQRSHQVS